MPSSCRSRQAIMRGLRPNAQQKIVSGVCASQCIYCDIWKLATLIFTRIPLASKYGTSSPLKLHRSVRADSPTYQDTYDWGASERMIDAQFQTQRARLASIMSIATVEGAEESEGLRIAHDRCLGSVKQLLYQERVLEDTILRSSQLEVPRRMDNPRRPSFNCATTNSSHYYYSSERRPSRVGLAM